VADSGAGVTPTCGQGCLVKSYITQYTDHQNNQTYKAGTGAEYDANCNVIKILILDSAGVAYPDGYYSFVRPSGGNENTSLLQILGTGMPMTNKVIEYRWASGNIVQQIVFANNTTPTLELAYTYYPDNNLATIHFIPKMNFGLPFISPFVIKHYDYHNGRPNRSVYYRLDSTSQYIDSGYVKNTYDGAMNLIKKEYYEDTDTNIVTSYEERQPSPYLAPVAIPSTFPGLDVNPSPSSRDYDRNIPATINNFRNSDCNSGSNLRKYRVTQNTNFVSGANGCVVSYKSEAMNIKCSRTEPTTTNIYTIGY
jgi:hypothetical protein